jgi:thiol-disulfide isomerase/thioredoxin
MKNMPASRVMVLATTLALAMAAALVAKPSGPPAIGQTVELKFNAVKGGKVDLATMKGKVVLIDFWATWCGPCVREIPSVVATYKKLHDKGFEIVGISLDSDKAALTKFIKDKEMPWPQYFDGKGWKNEISSNFGIRSIPAMWLVDKEGKLASTNARSNLEAEVEKLLAK